MFDDMDNIDNDAVPQALATRQEGAEALIPLLHERFTSFKNDTFRNMMWLDPQFWTDDRDYGKDSINGLMRDFETALENAGFNRSKTYSRNVLLSECLTPVFHHV